LAINAIAGEIVDGIRLTPLKSSALAYGFAGRPADEKTPSPGRGLTDINVDIAVNYFTMIRLKLRVVGKGRRHFFFCPRHGADH
jgi:hypothetical protein